MREIFVELYPSSIQSEPSVEGFASLESCEEGDMLYSHRS
jgi:hypothetical protein